MAVKWRGDDVKCAMRKLRPPKKHHGGKSYLCRRIIELMPPHRVYVEPFFGGGSVLLNKPRVGLEVASDVDRDLMQFWTTLRDHGPSVVRRLAQIPYREEIFRAAKGFMSLPPRCTSDPVERAAQYLVWNRMSRGGLGKDFAWSDRLRGGQPGDVNAWDTIRAELPAIAGRVEGVVFGCQDANEVIRVYDMVNDDVLVYADPPYLHATRTHRKAYAHEMTEAQHVTLLETLKRCRGTVMLSGYMSDLYRDMLAGWRLHQFDLPNHSGQGKEKQRRIECVWMNRD